MREVGSYRISIQARTTEMKSGQAESNQLSCIAHLFSRCIPKDHKAGTGSGS
jgi:hypothetical protein